MSEDLNKKQNDFTPKRYKSDSGLIFWMELRNESAEPSAPTIRTSDPRISVVIVPNNQSLEDVYLFDFRGKKIAFTKPSQHARLHSDVFEKLAARNPELDLVFVSAGQPKVHWYNPIARIENGKLVEENFHLDADGDLGSLAEFEEMSSVFFDLVQWMGGGATAMAHGSHQSKSTPFTPVKAGFDADFLKKMRRGGN